MLGYDVDVLRQSPVGDWAARRWRAVRARRPVVLVRNRDWLALQDHAASLQDQARSLHDHVESLEETIWWMQQPDDEQPDDGEPVASEKVLQEFIDRVRVDPNLTEDERRRHLASLGALLHDVGVHTQT